MSGVQSDEDVGGSVEERKARGREAARRSREKKKAQFMTLAEENEKLRKENEYLREKVERTNVSVLVNSECQFVKTAVDYFNQNLPDLIFQSIKGLIHVRKQTSATVGRLIAQLGDVVPPTALIEMNIWVMKTWLKIKRSGQVPTDPILRAINEIDGPMFQNSTPEQNTKWIETLEKEFDRLTRARAPCLPLLALTRGRAAVDGLPAAEAAGGRGADDRPAPGGRGALVRGAARPVPRHLHPGPDCGVLPLVRPAHAGASDGDRGQALPAQHLRVRHLGRLAAGRRPPLRRLARPLPAVPLRPHPALYVHPRPDVRSRPVRTRPGVFLRPARSLPRHPLPSLPRRDFPSLPCRDLPGPPPHHRSSGRLPWGRRLCGAPPLHAERSGDGGDGALFELAAGPQAGRGRRGRGAAGAGAGGRPRAGRGGHRPGRAPEPHPRGRGPRGLPLLPPRGRRQGRGAPSRGGGGRAGGELAGELGDRLPRQRLRQHHLPGAGAAT